MATKKAATPRTTRKKKPTAKVLHTLNADELLEYQNRHRLLVTKQMEFHAASNYVDILQNALIAEYDLPSVFDLNIETGVITEREEPDAQNGRV